MINLPNTCMPSHKEILPYIKKTGCNFQKENCIFRYMQRYKDIYDVYRDPNGSWQVSAT